jgi:hypothetical protein
VPDRLFTPRFFVMCGLQLVVFLSAFQLLPTAPFPHPVWAQRRRGRFVPRVPHLFVGDYRPHHRRHRGPRGEAARAARVERGDCVFLAHLRRAAELSADARPRHRARVFLVGSARGTRFLRDDIVPPHRRAERHELLGMSTIFAVSMAPAIG